MLHRELLYAMIGTGFTCFATIVGAATVYFFKGEMSHGKQRAFLGFAAGVMIAASVWSLLIPAMDMAEAEGNGVLLPVSSGFLIGGFFLMGMDVLLTRAGAIGFNRKYGNFGRAAILVTAITLHNIPEGMAVGLSFALAVQNPMPGAIAGASALALGMGLQNFPEGAAVALPLRARGASRGKAFLFGAASGVVEPIFGLIAVFLAESVSNLMPWILSFSAGAMIYVTVDELIPEARREETSHTGAISVMIGFLLMMLMDVLLG